MKLLKLLKALWKYIKKDKWKFYFFVALTFIWVITSLIYGFSFGKAISSLVEGNFNKFIFFLCVYNGFALFTTLFIHWPRSFLHNTLELNFMKRVSKDLYEKAINLPVKAYDEHTVGKITNRIYSDPDKVIELLGRIVVSIARVVAALMILIIAITTSWIITVEVLLLILFTYILSKKFYPKLKSSQEKIRKNSDKYVSDATQVLTGIRDVKGLGLKRIMGRIMSNNVDLLYDEQKKNRSYELNYDTGMQSMHMFFELVIFLTAGYLTYKGELPLSLFIAFEWYIWRLFDVINEITKLGTSYQKVVVSMTRISELLDNKLYSDEAFGDRNVKTIKGNIEFKDIKFAYEEEKKVLDGLTLKVETGKKIAIVGKSGMGKSTIFSMLLRFYEPDRGEIFIDGIDIKKFDEKSLRKHISIIRQDPYLFNKTIKENFKLIDNKITIKQIRELCRKAYIDEYIMNLPHKYDTLIGEGGVNLSGGQKQRLAIARTLAKKSKIILFDESTSALDNESQEYIKKTMDSLVKDHTIIIIAHRLSTIMDADLIYLVDKGKVVDSGTHRELIEKNKLYRKLYTPELMELNI